MSRSEVAVIDYGVGNLLSVRRGLEYCGAQAIVTSDADAILCAAHVVLPGVGAFSDGIKELRSRGLDKVVKEVAARGIPLLGICLGMQLMLDESEEFGVNEGLGLIRGRVIPIPAVKLDGAPQKTPHIGWNALVFPAGMKNWTGTLLHEVREGDAVYFVHSYMASPTDDADRVADCIYGGHRISAVVGRHNIFGCQFHPEKSGRVGLNVLRRFLAL